METESYSPFFIGGSLMNANRLKEIRAARRATQFDLRIKTGFSQSNISYWERGLLQPSEDQKQKLASALGVNVKDIFPEAA
jgi:transcriptional regulator with XRE-family HTH domain